MYARLNFVDVKPERFVDMDPFWAQTVAGYQDILVRGWFLRLGQSPTTLSLVLFTDAGAARTNSAQHLGPIAARASAMRLTDPVVTYSQVLAEDAAASGPPQSRALRAVIRSSHVAADRLEGEVAHWRAAADERRADAGFAGAMLLCDDEKNTLRSVCFYGDESHADDSSLAAGEFDAGESTAVAWQVRVDVGEGWPAPFATGTSG